MCTGQACEARTAGNRRAIREEEEKRGSRSKDVRPSLSAKHSRLDSSVSRAQSTLTNKSRLKLLQQREEHLQDLFATSRSSIDSLSSSEDRYVQFLQSIIVQGFLALLEPDVLVLTRDKDVKIAGKALESAQKQYHEISGRKVSARVEGGLSNEL